MSDTFLTLDNDTDTPAQADLATLAALIKAYAPHDGRFPLPIPDAGVIRASKTTTSLTHSLSRPGVCIVAQGAKQVTLGTQSYTYDPTRLVVYATEVPVATSIIQATKDAPYLCFVISLDPQRLAELALKVYPRGLPRNVDVHAIALGQSSAHIVKAAIRFMALLATPDDAVLLAPLIIDEILIRLLRSPLGAAVAQLGMADSNAHNIAKAISWLRTHYADPVKVETLANVANMSPSSFHQHFKSVTAMSPLQFQKVIRLQEARHLMVAKMQDVSTASLNVGYASVSQFSREYSRFFGNAPSKDISTLRTIPVSGEA